MTSDTAASFWRRFALGAVVIVAATALTTAIVGFTALNSIVSAFGGELKLGDLAPARSGAPQTVLVIGADRLVIGGQPQAGNSDTMILIRVDPSQHTTMMWSLPRDLQAQIPGHGTDKLNAAYAYGGDALTLATIQQLTGLQINHVIEVNYGGFQRAVDQVGCVYTDVDRRYFNDNADLPQGETYATINIDPGYQKLCGKQALDFVRYRHTDTDIVRSARQQGFLRQAGAQISTSSLISNEQALLQIFGQETRSDMGSHTEVLHFLNESLAARGDPIRTVPFEGTLGPSFVSSTPDQIAQMAARFLNGGRLPAAPPSGPSPPPSATAPPTPAAPQAAPSQPPPDLFDATADGLAQATVVRASAAPLPIYYPTTLAAGSSFDGPPRLYAIEGPKGRPYPSYRMVMSTGHAGEYYGLQATSWEDPPVLHQPSVERKIAGRAYRLYYAGTGLTMVAWRDHGAVYWLANSLSQSLSEPQMLAVATSTRPL